MRSLLFLLLLPGLAGAQSLITPFEKSQGAETATFRECISYYHALDKSSSAISIHTMGMSDAGYPFDVVLWSKDGQFDPAAWHKQGKVVILVINGIHPGEPDGVDASMMLLRDLAQGKITAPDRVVLAVIPIYNIGGALNRTSYSRVNQNGPRSYGFRGNAENLDLNRDFTKCDSRNAQSFTDIFHWLNPDIQLDNHVSDGADYQHTMTLISSQWNKLGGTLGQFSHDVFDPALYASMNHRGWPMVPYVNFEEGNPEKGWDIFMDPPRFSSGYAALFHTLGFIAETHMLKPFHDRVLSTYALMQAMMEVASAHATELLNNRQKDMANDLQKQDFFLAWKTDTSRYDKILFKGYEAARKTSEVTGQERLYYDHSKPFEKMVPFYNYCSGYNSVKAPQYYVLPQGWYKVVDLLRRNKVVMYPLSRDSSIEVEVYHIADNKSYPRAYESHHKNYQTKTSSGTQSIQFLKGDYLIPANQPAKRFLLEMLEPAGDDSYFAWNYFDAILQEKEGYSDYRWEDVAAGWLKDHPEVRQALEEKKAQDTAFAKNASAQLNFVYKKSPWYEPAHLRYPVYRIMPKP